MSGRRTTRTPIPESLAARLLASEQHVPHYIDVQFRQARFHRDTIPATITPTRYSPYIAIPVLIALCAGPCIVYWVIAGRAPGRALIAGFVVAAIVLTVIAVLALRRHFKSLPNNPFAEAYSDRLDIVRRDGSRKTIPIHDIAEACIVVCTVKDSWSKNRVPRRYGVAMTLDRSDGMHLLFTSEPYERNARRSMQQLAEHLRVPFCEYGFELSSFDEDVIRSMNKRYASSRQTSKL